jgi:hypothetical protein
MRRVACIIVVSLSAPAFADQAAPLLQGKAREAWIGQCAARMEKARDEAARRDPRFARGVVETTPREAAVAGDPTATSSYDQVEYTMSEGMALFQATVSTRTSENPLIKEQWSKIGTEQPTPLYVWRRHPKGLTGSVVGRGTSSSEPIRLFEAVFKRAIDDCLRMKR